MSELITTVLSYRQPEAPPFVADFATTAVANGKLKILQREGEHAPEGWIQDKNGNSWQT